MSTQSIIPTPTTAKHLLFIALSPNTNNPGDPDPIQSLLTAPSSEDLPANGLLYIYPANDDNTTSPIANSARVGNFTRIDPYPLRAPPATEGDTTTNPIIVAGLLIAEVSSVDTLNAHISTWSEEDFPAENPTPGNESVAGVMGVLTKLQELHKEEEGGSGVGSEGSKQHCLGRRMEFVGSLEAEGKHWFKKVTDDRGDVKSSEVPSAVEAMGVPTKVMFDWSGKWAVGREKQSGGDVEAGGKGKGTKDTGKGGGKKGKTDQKVGEGKSMS